MRTMIFPLLLLWIHVAMTEARSKHVASVEQLPPRPLMDMHYAWGRSYMPTPRYKPHPGDDHFDFYVLALSWQAAFCQECPVHGGCPGCSAPKEFWRKHFTLHGLWPEREDGSYPQNCEGDEFDAKELEDKIGMATLEEYWPNVKADDESHKYPSFWRHEWERHGTCSGLDMIAFFEDAIGLAKNTSITTPELIHDHVGATISTPELRKAYPVHVVLKCNNKHEPGILEQVFMCWEMDDHHNPINPRACPVSMTNEDTCVDSTVRILAFDDAFADNDGQFVEIDGDS